MGRKKGHKRCFVRKKGGQRKNVKAPETLLTDRSATESEELCNHDNVVSEHLDTVPISVHEVTVSTAEQEDTVKNTDICENLKTVPVSSTSLDHTYFKLDKQEQNEDSVCESSSLLDHSCNNQDQPTTAELNYQSLREECLESENYGCFSVLKTSKFIRYIQVCDNDFPFVRLCVTVDESFQLGIKVHNADLPTDHKLWSILPNKCNSVLDIKRVLNVIDSYSICEGNSDKHLVDLVPQGAFLDVAREQNRAGYKDNASGFPTVRSTACKFLVKSGRCSCCSTYRRTLTKALSRQRDRVATPKKNMLKSRMPISRLTESHQVQKIRQLRQYATSLENEVFKLQMFT